MTTSPVVTITDELVAELEASNVKGSRMNAYYYGFSSTNCGLIDAILKQVARAGKSFHLTEQWTEEMHDRVTPEDAIQESANHAALIVLALLSERAELKRDAERYRWLRGFERSNITVRDFKSHLHIEGMDYAIDQAMQERQE